MPEATYRKLEEITGRLGGVVNDLEDHLATSQLKLEVAHKLLDSAREALQSTQNEASQGEPFYNFETAFARAGTDVLRQLQHLGGPETLKIRVLAVASSLSWGFLIEKLPEILVGCPDKRMRVEVLLVEADHLRDMKTGMNRHGSPWWEISKLRETNIHEEWRGLPDTVRERLHFRLGFYRNLPHWHGVLIGTHDLWLGRTSWDSDLQNLTVGENVYRKFTRSGGLGSDRIDLFQTWFRYYQREARHTFAAGPGGE